MAGCQAVSNLSLSCFFKDNSLKVNNMFEKDSSLALEQKFENSFVNAYFLSPLYTIIIYLRMHYVYVISSSANAVRVKKNVMNSF